MKFIRRYILFAVLLLVSGCCCCPGSNNATNTEYQDSNSTEDSSSKVDSATENPTVKNASPLDMMKKSMEIRQLQDKYIKAQNDPNTSEEDLQKLEEEISARQEEMEQIGDNIQKSGALKGTPYENYMQKAKEARESAEEAKAKAEEAQREAMEQDYTPNRNNSYESDFEPVEEGVNE